ncbi:hypothetical protein ONZ45_g4550 [Pleurotus djamor]|nr:hypothetical protein ONZ45_g4550 [Pleurotus djamor]
MTALPLLKLPLHIWTVVNWMVQFSKSNSLISPSARVRVLVPPSVDPKIHVTAPFHVLALGPVHLRALLQVVTGAEVVEVDIVEEEGMDVERLLRETSIDPEVALAHVHDPP